jgi:hypothetical protein
MRSIGERRRFSAGGSGSPQFAWLGAHVAAIARQMIVVASGGIGEPGNTIFCCVMPAFGAAGERACDKRACSRRFAP